MFVNAFSFSFFACADNRGQKLVPVAGQDGYERVRYIAREFRIVARLAWVVGVGKGHERRVCIFTSAALASGSAPNKTEQ